MSMFKHLVTDILCIALLLRVHSHFLFSKGISQNLQDCQSHLYIQFACFYCKKIPACFDLESQGFSLFTIDDYISNPIYEQWQTTHKFHNHHIILSLPIMQHVIYFYGGVWKLEVWGKIRGLGCFRDLTISIR